MLNKKDLKMIERTIKNGFYRFYEDTFLPYIIVKINENHSNAPKLLEKYEKIFRKVKNYNRRVKRFESITAS